MAAIKKGTRPGQNQEAETSCGSSRWVTPISWNIYDAFPGMLAGCRIQNGATGTVTGVHIVCWHYKLSPEVLKNLKRQTSLLKE